MKGPGQRLDLDVRRTWECPLCGKRRRTGGDVVSLRCRCTQDRSQMRLLEQRRSVRSFEDVIQRVQSAPVATEPPTEGEPASGPVDADQPVTDERSRSEQPPEPAIAQEKPDSQSPIAVERPASQPGPSETPAGETHTTAEDGGTTPAAVDRPQVDGPPDVA